VVEKAMYAGDANVADYRRRVTHEAGSDGRLFRNRQVGRPGANDRDTGHERSRLAVDGGEPGKLMVFGVGDRRLQSIEARLVQPRHQKAAVRLGVAGADRGNLAGRFTEPE